MIKNIVSDFVYVCVHYFLLSISFGWTGYYLEKKLGGLRFLLVLVYLLALSQVLLGVMAFIVAKTYIYNVSGPVMPSHCHQNDHHR